MAIKRTVKENLREMLRESAGAAGWTVAETPWADAGEPGATIRTAGGKVVATVQDPDDAALIVACVKLISELCEER